MRNKLYISIVTAIALLMPLLSLAGILKGKITDTKGEPLPFATVYIQGTATGTSANADGEYVLNLQPGTHKVVCQYMGFTQSVYNAVMGSEVITHNFSLAEQTMQMKDVVIKANAEDPAYAIMRKVIKRRKFHLQQVKSFQTDIYLKGVFRNRAMPEKITGVMKKQDGQDAKNELGLDSAGKGVLYLCEEHASYYSQEPDKTKTIIRSVKQSGNPNGMGFDRMPPVATFYENNVNPFRGAAPRGFISPASDNALNYYNFKYLGEFRENGYVIDKIKVTPKRLYEPLFEGVIYIAEEDWAIYSLNLLATKKANIQMLDTLRIEQSHLNISKDVWVIKSQVLYPTISIFGFDIAGYFMTVYNNQKVNQPIHDSVFSGKVVSQYDKTANKKDSMYWEANRPVPLEGDEVKDYVVKDSLRIVFNAPKYIDSIRRRDNKFKFGDLLLRGIHYDTRMYKNSINTNALLSMRSPLVSYNTVEGVVVAPKIWWNHEIDTYNYLTVTASPRYSFANQHFNMMGRVLYRHDNKTWKTKNWSVGIEGGKYAFQINPNSTLLPQFNAFSTLVYGKNYMKLYERWDAALLLSRNHGNGFSWNAKLNYQKRMLLENSTIYSWSPKAADRITNNKPEALKGRLWEEHNAAVIKLSLSYQPGFTYTLFPDYKEPNPSRWPVFTLNYDKGVPNILDSKTDFDKWRFGIRDNLNLKMLGTLSYNIAAGGFLNKSYVSLPDMMHLSDNELILAAPYRNSFQLAPYYKYSNTEDVYGELHLEYNMMGLLTNKIPLLRQAQWYFILGTNTFFAGDKNYYTEAFASVDNLGFKQFRLLRVDLVHSWNSMKQQSTGIRLGFSLNSMVRISTGEAGEW